jgi:hypothetical protein
VSAVSILEAAFVVLVIAGYGMLAVVMLSRAFYSVIRQRARRIGSSQRRAPLPTNLGRDARLAGAAVARKDSPRGDTQGGAAIHRIGSGEWT